jgi:serine/threonine protein kinase
MSPERLRLQLNSYFGPYYLEKLIAIGGMAEIYLARTRGMAGFEKQLVLKVIQPDLAGNEQFVQMLVDEAKIAVGLNHPNICQTFDLGKISGAYFISMEFVDGADFFQILKGLTDLKGDLSIEAAVYVVQQALCGLDYAHNKCDERNVPLEIIHRDVSPQNILISRHGEVKLVDFGIAKAANLSHKTRAGVIKGKLVYMAPEQAWGKPVDQRVDIFSAGIVLYEALTMGSLYLDKSPAKLLERVREAKIDPPSRRRSGISDELDALVMKALRPDPDERYQSSEAFSEALRSYLTRAAPDFTELHLGHIIESVLAGERPRRQSDVIHTPRSGDSMDRHDFQLQGHSMIFKAEDLMASSGTHQAPDLEEPTPSDSEGLTLGKLRLLDEGDHKAHTLGDEFIVGRAGDLRLGDARVSRRHARIRQESLGRYVLEDLGSSNGTYLNEQKIGHPCNLSQGDIIRVGPFKMEFLLEAAPAAPSVSRQLANPPSLSPEAALGAASVDDVRATVQANDDLQPAKLESGAAVTLVMGEEQLTLEVGDKLPISHWVRVGGAELEGEAAAVVRRADGFWMEPSPGAGQPVLHNGRQLTSPAQLQTGDTVQVGPVELEFTE